MRPNVRFDQYNYSFSCDADGNQLGSPGKLALGDSDYNSNIKLTSYMQNDKRRVSMPPKDCSAVEVRRLRYLVGRGRKSKVILSGINMTVPEGAIYGLLGPSGSGKTTLLKSVVGQLQPSDGYVKVFGFQPNQPGSQIPGSAIGYMPQELAVYEDFTIEETLWYFGRLYRIPGKLIGQRINFLLNFLDLPRGHRLVSNMSGGQKRRVSLAAALVHSPPLLILDEPTVGVDPLLRQSIWQHLVTLTQTEKITVIVTTHYIEEARRANVVGLMRRGRLLAENTPDELMAKHHSRSLEDVFLKLCVTDSMRRTGTFAQLAACQLASMALHGPASSNGASSRPPSCNMSTSGAATASSPVGSEHKQTVGGSATGSGALAIESGASITDKCASKSLEDSSEATTAEAASLDGNNNSARLHKDAGISASHAHAKANLDIENAQGQLQSSKRVRGFQLKSLFKSLQGTGSDADSADAKANLNGCADEDGHASASDEKRRQSGSHYIEQLILAGGVGAAAATAGGVTGPEVPKIAIDHLELPMGFSNASYQASECGDSAFNELAMVSQSELASSARQLQAEMAREQQSHSANNNNSSTFDGMVSITGSKMGAHDDVQDEDDFRFMNSRELSTMSPGNKYDYKRLSVGEYCDTVSTITWKNYIRLKRNVPLLLFQFVLPAIQVILFCICVGNDPFDIPVAIVNEESDASSSFAALSTKFLQSIDSRLVRQVNYTNLNEAIESVRLGKNWGVVHIPDNFTLSIHKRFSGGLDSVELDESTIENSTIRVYPDMTNQPIGHAMEVAFRRAYNDISRQTFDLLQINPSLAEPPIRMENAIYGKIDMQNYLQYMSPGVLISISYIMATGLTSLAFIIERRDGLYDRTLAAGVDQVQMLIAHSIVQLVVMVVQISLVVFFTFVIYKVPTNGPFVWVFLLLLLQGLAGMSFGLMVSSICTEENTAIMMILGTFYPNLLLAGVIWPIEAIPHWLRWFSYLQPQTLPTQSLRDLIVRGWSIDQPGVYQGFAVTSIWLVVFLIISCISFKLRH